MNKADDFLPKFFKVYLPDDSGDDLELPISVNTSLPKSKPRTVTVSSIYGKNWKMALRKCGGDVEKYVLVNGWKRIAKDEDLTGGEFFEFEFDGSRSFNFCIYERQTMCKRLRKSSVHSDEIKEESSDGEEEASSDDVIVLDDDDDDDSDDVDNDYTDDSDAGDDYADGTDYVDAASVEDDDLEAIDDAEADDDDDVRQYLDDCNNPSFTVALNPKKKSQLHIPAQVVKDYGLNFPESITVVDPLAKKFGTLEKKIKIQVNGSVFVKGFGSIIRRNKVKLTDKMVCELKKTGNNLVHTIKVYVING